MNTAVDVVGGAGNQGHELSIMSKVLLTILIIMCYPLLWSGAFNCSSRNNHNFTYLMLVMLVLCFCSETSIISSILDLFIPLIKYISLSEWSACFSGIFLDFFQGPLDSVLNHLPMVQYYDLFYGLNALNFYAFSHAKHFYPIPVFCSVS